MIRKLETMHKLAPHYWFQNWKNLKFPWKYRYLNWGAVLLITSILQLSSLVVFPPTKAVIAQLGNMTRWK